MTLRVPRLPIALDPLIAEAKRRARLRRWLIVWIGVVATGVGVAAVELGQTPHAPLVGPGQSVSTRIESRWQVRLGTFPVVAYGAGSVWAASDAATPYSVHGQLVRLDPRTGKRLATFPVGWWPSQVAVGAGGVWVADTVGDGSRLAHRPPYNSGPLPGLADAVSRIDPSTNRVVATIPLRGIQSIAVGGGSVWTAANGPRVSEVTIGRIDPAGNHVTEVRTLPAASGPLVWGGGHLWTLAGDIGPITGVRVLEIAPNSGRIVASLSVPNVWTGAALAYHSGTLLLGNQVAGASSIMWISTRGGLSVLRRQRVGVAHDLVITPSGIWAGGESSVILLAARTGTVRARISIHGWVGITPNVIAASGRDAWFVSQTATPTDIASHLISVRAQDGHSP
jgi:hypothetical protein